MAKITPEELIQDVKEPLLEDYTFDPPRVPRFFISNIFGRVFAHLVGRSATASKMLRCTEAGELKTAPTTTGIETYEVKDGTATDSWVVEPAYAATVSRVDIFVWDNPLLIRFKHVIGTWLPTFEVPVGFYSVDLRTNQFQRINKNPGSSSRFQIIGWW